MGKLALIVILMLLTSMFVAPTSGTISQLPPDVKIKLTNYLQRISKGWDQEAINGANQILMNISYSSVAWENFFTEYFDVNSFTDDLRNYLGYPVFWWFSTEAHLNLQNGLIFPMKTNIKRIMEKYHENPSDVLLNNSTILQTLMNSHRFLNDIAKVGIVSDEVKHKIYRFYIDLVNGYPRLLKKDVTFNPSVQPYLAAIRAQTWLNLRDMIVLNQSIKEEIAKTIGLGGRYLDIWNEFSVLVIDNNGFDTTQIEVIYDLLSKIPKNLHELGSITCNDLLGNTGERYLWIGAKMSVNIINYKVGSVQENGFPSDAEPKYSDVFTLVLVHEVNHAIDAYLTNKDEEFRARKADLIARAGNNNMNYLRSMFEDDFFVKAPQEFFASISNQWFSDSFHTLELALTRFKNGYREPINQFLFFADAYSQGGTQTLFYTLDTQGNIAREVVPITRDAHGHINSIHYQGILYHFTLDENGNVLEVSLNPSFKLGIDVFRNQDAYIAEEIDVYNVNMTLVGSISRTNNYSTVLPLGTYFANASIAFNNKTYSSLLKEINLSYNLTIGIVFRFADQILIQLSDVSKNSVSGAIVTLLGMDENITATTDNMSKVEFRDIYSGNWSIIAKKYGFPILNITFIVNRTSISANYTVMLGDFKVKVYDQYGEPLEKVEVSLVNHEWKLSFSQTIQKEEECFFRQIPITSYTLTIQDPYKLRSYSVDLRLTRQIDVKVVVVEVIPIWVYGLLLLALASALVIAGIEIRKRKLR